MDENFFTIQILLEGIRTDLIQVSQGVLWVAQSLGILGGLMYVAKLAYEGMLGGNLFSLRSFRPFVLCFILLLYPQFMLIIDGIAMSVNNGLAAAMTPNDYRISDVLKTRDLDPETDSDDNLIGIEDIYAEENEAEASLVD